MFYTSKFLWLGLICLSLVACEEELPPETQNGRNTFGCKVNGQVWIPSDERNDLNPYWEPNGGLFSINAHKAVGSDNIGTFFQSFSIGITWLPGLGKYPVLLSGVNNSYADPKDSWIYFNDQRLRCQYGASVPTAYVSGSIEITRYDTINNIVAGRFEGILTSPGCDTLRVTEGRFDFKFQ